MELVLPPAVSAAAFQRALTAFAGVVGKEWVLATDEDRQTYLDLYAPGIEAEREHAPSAAVVPQSVEQVQAIVRIANEHRIPLWPICRGKNFGYGGAAPVQAGSVILDMARMNRILEVNKDLAYCVVEPGVGFYDLHEYLGKNNIPLWLSIPGNGWGSVMGNALERGFSRTPYGEHGNSICGLEVVLPNGELVRTATGAMANSKTWPLFKPGFGPSWDQMFCQSNFGIVTKMGFWLMPEPQSTLSMTMSVPRQDDIGWLVDVLTPLRLSGVIPHNVGIANYLGNATTQSQRRDWFNGDAALPDDVIDRILATYKVGWWNFTLTLYGLPEVNELHRQHIENVFKQHTDRPFTVTRWQRGATGGGGPPAPSVFALRVVNWHGGRGAHLGFSPILPGNGAAVLEQVRQTRNRYNEFGCDYSSTIYVCGRHVINVNLMLYDKDNTALVKRTNDLFATLVKDAAAAGYGEYRTHLSWMDEVAASFDFNKQGLRRLNEQLKDALDPNGILAPGKSGIWPKRYRAQQKRG